MDNERKNKIEYHKEGDYYVPNLVIPKDEYPDYCIGKYGRLRLNYLKENKKAEYTIMLMEGTLRKHIVETDMQAKDKVERIYINFCNPWPRGKHHKKRLTHTRQLEKYKQFLINGGKIYFKTDDDNLFNDSINYFKETGFNILKYTYDLQKEPDFWNNIKTEHEDMFIEQGIKIKALIAEKLVADK